MTVGGMGFIPESLLMMMMMRYIIKLLTSFDGGDIYNRYIVWEFVFRTI